MADLNVKTFNARFQSKIDTYANWIANDPVLLEGEIGVVVVPAETGAVKQEPATLIKIGDGTKKFSELSFLKAGAADVAAWALADTKPVYNANEIQGLSDYIAGKVEDTNTVYNLVQDSANGHILILQKKELGEEAWTEVTRLTIPDNDTKYDAAISALEAKVGNTSVDSQIDAKIAALDLSNTYEEKGAAAQALSDAKDYTNSLAGNYDEKGAAAAVDAKLTAEVGRAQGAEAANAAAAKAAQDDVDALSAKVGEVAEGKTVVEMIAEAQTAATYDDTQIKADIVANSSAIAAEKARAEAAEKVNADAIAAVKEDVDAFLASAEVGEAAVDTLKEIQTYITEDGAAADQMVKDIAANKTAIESEVARAGAAESALGERITALEGVDHSHANADVLNGITATKVADWDDAVSKEHTHTNKAELDKIVSGDKAKWDQAVSDLAAVKADYLKGSDKAELVEDIAAAQKAADDAQSAADAAQGTADTANATANAAKAEIAALAPIAKTGDVGDLTQTTGEYIVFNAGTASTVI